MKLIVLVRDIQFSQSMYELFIMELYTFDVSQMNNISPIIIFSVRAKKKKYIKEQKITFRERSFEIIRGIVKIELTRCKKKSKRNKKAGIKWKCNEIELVGGVWDAISSDVRWYFCDVLYMYVHTYICSMYK